MAPITLLHIAINVNQAEIFAERANLAAKATQSIS